MIHATLRTPSEEQKILEQRNKTFYVISFKKTKPKKAVPCSATHTHRNVEAFGPSVSPSGTHPIKLKSHHVVSVQTAYNSPENYTLMVTLAFLVILHSLCI